MSATVAWLGRTLWTEEKFCLDFSMVTKRSIDIMIVDSVIQIVTNWIFPGSMLNPRKVEMFILTRFGLP